MFPVPDSDDAREGEVLAERVEALATWIQELDARLGAAEVATGDPKAAKELRKAVEAVAKHDPKLEDRLTNRVDVLKDRLATLAETVATTSASLAARDGEVAGLRRALEAETSRIEALAADLRKGSGSHDVDRLRKEVAALASGRPRSRGADKVPGKLEILEQRLDTLAKTTATTAAELASRDGDLAALRRQLADETASVQAALAEVRAAVDPAPMAELRLNVKELSDRTTALRRQSRQGIDGLGAQMTTVTGRLESLAQAVATTSEGLATADHELAALRVVVDEETTRLDSHVTSIEQVLGGVTAQLGALEGFADRDSVEALEEAVHGVSETVRGISERLQQLGQEVAETGRGYADRELELAALSRAFEEGRTQVESLVRDLSEALATMPEPGPDPEQEARLQELSRVVEEQGRAVATAIGSLAGREQELAELRRHVQGLAQAGALVELEERLRAVTGQVDGLGQRVLELDTASADAREKASGARAELVQGIELVARKIEDVERVHHASAADLARALETSAEEREALAAGARLLDERVRGLSEGLDALSLAAEESVRSGSDRDRELLDLSQRLEGARTETERLASELRSELQALAHAGGGTEHEARLEALGQRVDALDRTLRELAGAREEDSGARDALTKELATLRSTFDEETGRLDTHVARVEQAVEALPDRASLAALEERMHGVSEAVAHVSGRVQELATQVEGAAQGYAERELELTALTRAFEEAKSGVEALGSQVRSEVQELARAGGAEHDERLETLTAQMDDLRARLLELDAASASAREDSSGVRAELTQVIASVERRVEALASEHAASAAELRTALEAATEERESLAAGSRLLEERMRGVAEAAATAAGPDPALEAHLQELGAQVAEGRQRVATLTSDLQGALDSLSVRLDGLGADVEAVARVRADKEHEVAELALRFEQAGAKVDSLVGDLQRSLESVPEQKPDSELEGRFELLGQRLDTLAAAVEARAGSRETDLLLGKVLLRLDSLEREQESLAAELESAPAGAGSSEDELAELRLLIEGVRMRLAAKEDELSAIGGAQDVATRLDEVAARLDRLEETGANATPGEGLPADGRLRRELRELEHRMEHAEAAARENREAVLVQIERLASRVEWRLQQLESEEPVAEGEKPAPASVPKARVVPIRGSDV